MLTSRQKLRAGLPCFLILLALAACTEVEPEEATEPVQVAEPEATAEAAADTAVATDKKRGGHFRKLQELRSRSQRRVIRHFFDGRRDGVFVDVGSAHYRDLSMTYFLEKDFGWTGVAIDALESWAAGYAENRPGTRFFAFIVTDHEGAKEPFYRLKGDIGSTALKERADMLEADWASEVTEVLVPTTTMNALLDRAAVTKIDFLSMDIEGAEPIALAAFDIERFKPELIGIEVFPENQEAILAYFEEHGYERIDAYLTMHEDNWFFTCKVASMCSR